MYAYLLSTLPGFAIEDAPPMSLSELLDHCRGFVPEAALAALTDPEAGTASGGDVASTVRRWLDGERQLVNATTRRRAAFWGLNPAEQARQHGGFSVMIEDAVARAFEASDPLARQRALDALRWQLLDELAGPLPWQFAALFAYAQRLRLAWRWAGREPAAGRESLGHILDTVEEHHG